jgi:hypothetical protein
MAHSRQKRSPLLGQDTTGLRAGWRQSLQDAKGRKESRPITLRFVPHVERRRLLS